MSLSDFIPFARPSIGEEEIREVEQVLRNGWLTTGAKTLAFETAFAQTLGVPHALAVNSATAGLHLALEAVGIGPGDKVIVPVHTFTATAEVVRYLGADPVFVDVEAHSLNISLENLAAAAEAHRDVKAVVPVHFAGMACDMVSICDLAERHGWYVIEDAAHALPCTHDGRHAGTIGHLGVFSFYATKTITTGEGGMVVTAQEDWAERVRTMRLHGISRDVFNRYTTQQDDWYYEVVAPGFKYNMTDIAAAIGIHQLAKAEQFRGRREQIARQYTEAFADLPLELPPQPAAGDLHAWHLYVIRILVEEAPIDRDAAILGLKRKGIGTSVHFIPLHLHPYWRDRYGLKPDDFPVSYDAYRRSLSLPIYPGMSDEDVGRVIEAVRAVFLGRSR